MALITVVDDDHPEAPTPAQDGLGATFVPPLGADTRRREAGRSVASWLRGKSFPLGQHTDTNLGPAYDLIRHLWLDGYVLEYIGDDR